MPLCSSVKKGETDMDYSTVTEQLFNIINEYSQVEVTEDNYMNLDILDDCGYNSIQTIELICSIEDVFGIEFDEDVLNINNIRPIVNICKYISGKII